MLENQFKVSVLPVTDDGPSASIVLWKIEHGVKWIIAGISFDAIENFWLNFESMACCHGKQSQNYEKPAHGN